jgi:hypothetical protein
VQVFRIIGQRSEHSREVALNQQVKDLIQKLGEAIHESVAESDSIAGVVREIREQGFDVLLMLEATIGLNESEDEADAIESEEAEEEANGPFTRNDLTFLKSLRITTEEHDTQALPDGAGPQAALPPPAAEDPGPEPSGSTDTSSS